MNTKNTQKETTKKASAPETRITVAEIREAGGKFHIYTLPGGFYHCTCVNREDAEEVMAERFPPVTGEGTPETREEQWARTAAFASDPEYVNQWNQYLSARREPPEDYYCGRSAGTSVTDSLAWAAQWSLDWMRKNAAENKGIISALEDSLNAYDKKSATGEGNAPRVADLNASALLSGANPSEGKLIDELALANLQKEQNWEAYQEALRLLDKAEAHRDELLAASKRFYTIADKLDHDSISTDLWNEYVVAQDAFKDAIDNAEGRAQ